MNMSIILHDMEKDERGGWDDDSRWIVLYHLTAGLIGHFSGVSVLLLLFSCCRVCLNQLNGLNNGRSSLIGPKQDNWLTDKLASFGTFSTARFFFLSLSLLFFFSIFFFIVHHHHHHRFHHIKFHRSSMLRPSLDARALLLMSWQFIINIIHARRQRSIWLLIVERSYSLYIPLNLMDANGED